jgi:UDP-N-acetylmuramate dehydrogenase
MVSIHIQEIIERIESVAGLEVHAGASLSDYTTIGIGGRCGALVQIGNEDSLVECLSLLRDTGISTDDIFILGGGSNLLVSDGGFDGFVLRLGKGFEEWTDHGDRIDVGAALPIRELSTLGVRRGWGGFEYFTGLPGTIGGAIRMNAGAWGKEIWDFVLQVRCVDYRGNRVVKSRSDVSPGYRNGGLESDLIVMGAELTYQREKTSVLKQRSKQFMVQRKTCQAIRHPSFGSVFKNPEGFHTGKLIDSLGLKGRREGNAMISEEHANFIVNLGGARAVEVLVLMRVMRHGVREEYGIDLEPEVVFLGITDAELEGIR